MRKPLPRPDKHYVSVPNEYFDKWLTELSGNECLILSLIIRKTLGYNKPTDWISLSQFIKFTGLSKNTIIKNITRLADKEMIIKHKEGEVGEEKSYYKLNIEDDTSAKIELGGVQELTETSAKNEPTINSLTINNKESRSGKNPNNVSALIASYKIKYAIEFNGAEPLILIQDIKALQRMKKRYGEQQVDEWLMPYFKNNVKDTWRVKQCFNLTTMEKAVMSFVFKKQTETKNE